MIAFVRDRPWIWIVFAFIVLIGSWVVLFKVAIENGPETIEIPTTASHGD